MISYQYFESDDLLISRFEENIELSDIISFIGFSRTTVNAKKNLYDVRDADFNVRIDDLPQIIAERNKFPADPGQVAVFLLGKPRDTVLGTLLVENTRHLYNLHICSSIEVALSYLNIPSSKQVLEERMKHLSTRFI